MAIIWVDTIPDSCMVALLETRNGSCDMRFTIITLNEYRTSRAMLVNNIRRLYAEWDGGVDCDNRRDALRRRMRELRRIVN
jgi:hypothetical protein